jgi:hypothetical protein
MPRESCRWMARHGVHKGGAMNSLLLWVGRIAGVLGLGAMVCAVALRLSGIWYVGGLQTGTLMNAGVAAMVVGAWAYAASMAERPRSRPP